jgi:hypothetical protein
MGEAEIARAMLMLSKAPGPQPAPDAEGGETRE